MPDADAACVDYSISEPVIFVSYYGAVFLLSGHRCQFTLTNAFITYMISLKASLVRMAGLFTQSHKQDICAWLILHDPAPTISISWSIGSCVKRETWSDLSYRLYAFLYDLPRSPQANYAAQRSDASHAYRRPAPGLLGLAGQTKHPKAMATPSQARDAHDRLGLVPCDPASRNRYVPFRLLKFGHPKGKEASRDFLSTRAKCAYGSD